MAHLHDGVPTAELRSFRALDVGRPEVRCSEAAPAPMGASDIVPRCWCYVGRAASAQVSAADAKVFADDADGSGGLEHRILTPKARGAHGRDADGRCRQEPSVTMQVFRFELEGRPSDWWAPSLPT